MFTPEAMAFPQKETGVIMRKYPHGGGFFLAKTMAGPMMGENERANTALSSACYVWKQEA